jgi:hypothetical protein
MSYTFHTKGGNKSTFFFHMRLFFKPKYFYKKNIYIFKSMLQDITLYIFLTLSLYYNHFLYSAFQFNNDIHKLHSIITSFLYIYRIKKIYIEREKIKVIDIKKYVYNSYLDCDDYTRKRGRLL